MIWIILLVFAIVFFILYKQTAKKLDEEHATLAKDYPYTDFNFPEHDADGNELQNTYSFELTGSHHKINDEDPEFYVRRIAIGDPVFFKHQDVPGYPAAYAAFNVNGKPLGWLPESHLNRETVVRRLERNLTVLCCAEKKGSFEDRYGNSHDCLIVKVAIYNLPKKSKS